MFKEESASSEMLEGSAGINLCRKSSFRTDIKASSEVDPLLLTATPIDSMSKSIMVAA